MIVRPLIVFEHEAARAFGEALHKAYKGELEFHCNEEDHLPRATWTR